MNEQVLHKLKVLAESAKYDVSCSSSGAKYAAILREVSEIL